MATSTICINEQTGIQELERIVPDRLVAAGRVILREINTKAKGARFKKVDRGLFALTGKK